MNARSKIALFVVVLAGVAALAAGTVYAISVEVPARGTFATTKDKVNLARGIARLVGEPADAAVQKICSSRARGRTGTPTPAPSR